jgi:hypothetical protein
MPCGNPRRALLRSNRNRPIWDVERGQELQTARNSRSVYAMAFDSRCDWLASGPKTARSDFGIQVGLGI